MEETLEERELQELFSLLEEPAARVEEPRTVIERWKETEQVIRQMERVMHRQETRVFSSAASQVVQLEMPLFFRENREEQSLARQLFFGGEAEEEAKGRTRDGWLLENGQVKDTILEEKEREKARLEEKQTEQLRQEVRSFFTERQKETERLQEETNATNAWPIAFYNQITLQQGAGWQQLIQQLTEELEHAMEAGCTGVHR